MILYLDLIIILNFSINFLFMMLLELSFGERIMFKRIIVSSTVAVLFLIVYLFNYTIYNTIKISGGFILVLIESGINDIKKVIAKSSCFYLFEFGLIGIVKSFYLTGLLIIIGLIVLAFFILVQSMKKQYIFLSSYKYNINITMENDEIKLKGFFDSGNLSCYKGVPIIYLDYKYYKYYYRIIGYGSVDSINNSSKHPLYKPKQFTIFYNKNKESKDVYVVFSTLGNDIDCILNANLFI